MASISRDKNGRKRLLFMAEDNRRKTIRLGKMSIKQAEAFKVKLEALIAGRMTGSIDDETARWIAQLPDNAHDKLAAVGLVKQRASLPVLRLKEFLDEYAKGRCDVKSSTQLVYARTTKWLLAFFGPDKALQEITEGDADQWRLYLVGQKLAENTIRRTCGVARQFFRAAIRRKLIQSNPFTDLKSAVQPNRTREFFLSRQDAQKILETCPDMQWRLIFALACFGGLRTPSEMLLLRWSDINWERGQMLVHSPKTERHPGGESRLVPIFPELYPYLMAAYHEAEPGTEYVITRYRKSGLNLRTQLMRILAKAGIKPWPKLFQNLRSTRETELVEQWPEHVVCAWLGNTRAVARKYYLQVTDEHFQQAAQNAAQYGAARRGIEQNVTLKKESQNADLQLVAAQCRPIHEPSVGDTGLEPVTPCV